jgi:hypothetical protein
LNIKVDALAAGKAQVEELLDGIGEAVAEAIRDAGRFQMLGMQAATNAGISPGLIGSVLDYLGRMQADLGHAALMLQGVHASLHEALERLAPNDDPQKAGGGGEKTPPPKP